MSGVQSEEIIAQQSADDENSASEVDHHIYCCEDENLGLCGKDLTGYPFEGPDGDVCATCKRLEEAEGEGWIVGDPCRFCPADALGRTRGDS